MSDTQNQRRVVIFDMGNVLIDWDPDTTYQAHIADDQERALFFAGLFRRMHWAVHDSDGSFSDALLSLKQAEPGSRALIEQFEHGWHEFLRGPIASSVAVLEALVAAKVPVFGLTNWPHQMWPPKTAVATNHNYGFLQHFEDVVVSGQVKMHKPDEDIYEYALSRFGVRPDEAVFVDDLLENIETANRLGLHGIQFTDAASLHVELARLGLL